MPSLAGEVGQRLGVAAELHAPQLSDAEGFLDLDELRRLLGVVLVVAGAGGENEGQREQRRAAALS